MRSLSARLKVKARVRREALLRRPPRRKKQENRKRYGPNNKRYREYDDTVSIVHLNFIVVTMTPSASNTVVFL